jgi:hypothetical protein
MSQCTWKGKGMDRCTNEAEHRKVADDGQLWANLCALHNTMFDEAIGLDIRTMLSYWIAAQGGPAVAANRMTKGPA